MRKCPVSKLMVKNHTYVRKCLVGTCNHRAPEAERRKEASDTPAPPPPPKRPRDGADARGDDASKKPRAQGEARAPPAAPTQDRVFRGQLESLGWLAGGSAVTREAQAITGVTDTSIADLQAQVYRSLDERRDRKERGIDAAEARARARAKKDPLAAQNRGVQERAERDRQAHEAERPDSATTEEILRRKAQMYDAIAAGTADLPEDACNVDFVRKGYLEDEDGAGAGPAPATWAADAPLRPGADGGGETWAAGGGAARGGERVGMREEILRQAKETELARAKVQAQGSGRGASEGERRKRLREEYVRRRMARLKQGKSAGGAPQPPPAGETGSDRAQDA
ncbi:unnamed protein product [Pedinophyceae sp. YPF-701]|nr:unnamed protein product [Pedinophyceae sp. YPF-701]